LTLINDNLTEGDETILIEIGSVSGGNGASENGTQLVSITIIDDDNHTSYIGDPSTNLNTLLTTGNCPDCDLSGIFLDGNDNQTANNITHVNLSNANLTNATLQNIQFEGDNFSQARLDNTSLQSVFFAGVDLNGVIGSGLKITESLLVGVSINHAQLSQSYFDNSSFIDSSITYSNLDNSSFVATGLYNTSLGNVSLLGADLRGLYFDNATGSTLDNVTCDSNTQRPANLGCVGGYLQSNSTLVDDHSNSFDNATGIKVGKRRAGYLALGDNDTFAFQLAFDNATSINLSSQVALHPHLYHDNGTQVFYNDNQSSDNNSAPLCIKPNCFMTTLVRVTIYWK